MRKQDVLIFLLCAAGLFFVLQQEGTMTLQKGFSILHNAPHSLSEAVEHELSEHDIVNLGDSNTMSQYQEHGPKPIVTDLDGDGYNELIVFQKADDNSGPSVKILSFKQLLNRPPLQGNDKFVQLSTKKRLVFKTSSRGRIVGMATGYLTPNDREQKIVVVFANWKVLMFDHELKLMWESKIISDLDRDELMRIRSPKEVVVAISPYRIHRDDKGIVVIGLRQYNFKQHSHTEDKVNNPDEQPEVSHYSYYAFDGLTGVQRWKHESRDFQFANEEETVYPQHNYKIDAKQHTQHSGEVHWRTYKEDILRNLPHVFRHPQDTQIELDHFIPSHKRKQQSKTDSSEYGDLGSRLFENLKYLKKPTVVTPTTAIPNVVVSHLSKGMEVIHIYTGRTLCQVAPLKSRTAYADLNSDGVVDAAEARKADPNAGECVGVIESGSQSEVLFQTPICENTQGLAQFSVFRVKEEDPEALKHVTAVPPAIMTKSDVNQAKVQRDVTFLVSTGLVTDVFYDFNAGEWRVRWQTLTPSKFGVSNEKKNKAGEVDKDKEVEDISYAEIRPFALRKYEPDSFVLAVGDNYLTVLDSYGTVQSVIELPQSSSSPLIFADINNDKINDVIVTTNEGYYGYVTRTHSGNSVLTSLVVCVAVIVVLLYLSSSIEIRDESFQKNPSLKQQ